MARYIHMHVCPESHIPPKPRYGARYIEDTPTGANEPRLYLGIPEPELSINRYAKRPTCLLVMQICVDAQMFFPLRSMQTEQGTQSLKVCRQVCGTHQSTCVSYGDICVSYGDTNPLVLAMGTFSITRLGTVPFHPCPTH